MFLTYIFSKLSKKPLGGSARLPGKGRVNPVAQGFVNFHCIIYIVHIIVVCDLLSHSVL